MSEESRIATPEPLDRGDAVNLAHNIRGTDNIEDITRKGILTLVDGVLRMDAELTRLYRAQSANVPASVEELIGKLNTNGGICYAYHAGLIREFFTSSATGSITPHPDTLWVVWFEDKDHGHEVFFGPGAEDGARRRYKEALDNWSCHLLVRVPTDSPAEKA